MASVSSVTTGDVWRSPLASEPLWNSLWNSQIPRRQTETDESSCSAWRETWITSEQCLLLLTVVVLELVVLMMLTLMQGFYHVADISTCRLCLWPWLDLYTPTRSHDDVKYHARPESPANSGQPLHVIATIILVLCLSLTTVTDDFCFSGQGLGIGWEAGKARLRTDWNHRLDSSEQEYRDGMNASSHLSNSLKIGVWGTNICKERDRPNTYNRP